MFRKSWLDCRCVCTAKSDNWKPKSKNSLQNSKKNIRQFLCSGKTKALLPKWLPKQFFNREPRRKNAKTNHSSTKSVRRSFCNLIWNRKGFKILFPKIHPTSDLRHPTK